LTEPVLERHRAKSGIEGSWTAYFSLFKQALDAKAVAFAHEKQGLALLVHYPLIAGARITGTFELGQGLPSATRREAIQTLLFKLASLALRPPKV
jgi:hypothetical protein